MMYACFCSVTRNLQYPCDDPSQWFCRGGGGGGQGASSTSVENPLAGVDYTGGGGGGANSANPEAGKKGGDGIVIVAYL